MGILDDAIRDHLELKRKGGAREADLRRLESEAFADGRWNEGLRELAALPPPVQPRIDGAEVVAAMIAERLSAP